MAFFSELSCFIRDDSNNNNDSIYIEPYAELLRHCPESLVGGIIMVIDKKLL